MTTVRSDSNRIRVLYSFPHKLGAGRICQIAWQQVAGLLAAGADVLVFPGVLHKPFRQRVDCRPTLALGRLRIPYSLLGTMRACVIHDWIVSKRLRTLAGKVDIVHTWPLGALETLKVANTFGIPTVLERPNSYTRFAYSVVQRECERLGVTLPPGSEGAYDAEVLRREEEEYQLAFRLLCPSDFVLRTFVDAGFQRERLARHTYGFDENVYYPDSRPKSDRAGLKMLFVGVSAVRKGVHHALQAWHQSPASRTGTFLIAGDFLPAYAEKLAPLLNHPSVQVLGHRNDVPDLMRNSDVLVLPSIEEGFGLVIAEAMGSGCVPLASEACTEICEHLITGLVHPVGDVETLTQQITMLHDNRSLLERLRTSCITISPKITWNAAGRHLLGLYRDILAAKPTRVHP